MSNTYCAKLWNHQYLHMSGSFRFCCATNDNIMHNGNRLHINNDSLIKAWNTAHVKETRLKMIRGEDIPECIKCVEQESRGYKSMREPQDIEKNFALTKNDGTVDIMPTTMELHLGNLCNLKCKMCGQNYSNQIGKELLEIGETDKEFLSWVYKQSGNVNNWTNNLSVEYTWFQNKKTKNKLFDYIAKNIKTLTVIGGEPTVIPEFWELFSYLEKNNTLKDQNITVVTNLTNINPKFTDWLPKLNSWTIWASIDGLGDITEYIRYPSNFKKVVENLNFYKKLLLESNNGKIVFSPAIQLLNIHQLDDMLKWFINFADNYWGKQFNVSWMSQVWYPRICNYDTAPKQYRYKVADKLEESVNYFTKYNDISFFYNKQIKNLRNNFIEEPMEKHLQKAFIRYNDTQDKHRKGKTWRELLPDLEQALTDSIS
ncbi:MAG: radical SAM protein [Proteobacteria bacterium]|nr:radical SAM protein [Pseudomonadota bacterium]